MDYSPVGPPASGDPDRKTGLRSVNTRGAAVPKGVKPDGSAPCHGGRRVRLRSPIASSLREGAVAPDLVRL